MAQYHTHMSLQLCQALDGYGFTRSFLEYRRKLCDYTIFYINSFDDDEAYMFLTGSKRDALCTFEDAESDLDALYLRDHILVSSETDLRKPECHKKYMNGNNLHHEECILEKGQKPGYYYLKYKGGNTDVKNLSSFRGCMYFDNTFKEGLLEEAIKDEIAADVRIHGPAIAVNAPLLRSQLHQLNFNGVFAARCLFLPEDYDEWVSRKRDNGWPPEWIIETAKKEGCLLVGVGHPASDTNTIEWRLSMNKTEHFLIKSFNNVQMKCYVMLRMVLKWIIQPNLHDTFTSYHAKSVMFWLAEEKEKHFWRPENIAECFMCSLIKLRTYVENGYCPSYFLTDVNLLEGKLEGDIHKQVLDILDSVITEGPSVVYRCVPLNVYLNGATCNHLDDVSCACLNEHLREERLEEIVDSVYSINDDLLTTVNMVNVYRSCRLGLLDWHVANEFHNKSISDSHTFSSISVCEELGLANKHLYYLQKEYTIKLRGNGYVARIKLATFFYYRRQLICCVPLLSLVIKSMETSNEEFELCTNEARAEHVEQIEGVECIYLTQNNKEYRVSEIVFGPSDKRLIPFDLQDEMGRLKKVNGTYYEGWVFVDSIVYAYYLLILSLHDLRRYRGITKLFGRFHKVCTQQPGAIRIFRKDMAYRLYSHAFMLVWAATKGFTRLS